MWNFVGPSQRKKELLTSVVTSVLLYGTPLWKPPWSVASVRERLEQVRCTVALKVRSAYRTTTIEFVYAIAGALYGNANTGTRQQLYGPQSIGSQK